MNRWLVILTALVLWTIGLCAQTNAPVRLALIAPEAALRPALDLLTVELSRSSQIALLERTEIERVLREKSLAATSKDYLKVGQVLGADGMLIASTHQDGISEFVDLRLVAVKPGVVLGAGRSPWPVEDPIEWARFFANHFASLFPKVGVLVKDAIPISVLNFRSAIRSREAEELERQLTVLAVERLSREKQLFVLERRDMASLTFEKGLEGLDDSGFWSGSYLLEGTVDREGYSPGRMTLTAQVRPARGGAPIQIEVSGSRTNPLEAINQLTEKIVAGLKLQPSEVPWNPQEEAGKYFEEAKWAYRWGMLAEAAAACETSWALGRQTAEVTALRILSYYENGINRAQGYYDLEHRLVTFGQGIPPKPGEFSQPYQPALGCGVPPDSVRFSRVRRALELCCAGFRQFIATNSNPGWQWHDLGIDLLEGVSYWLRHYYYLPEGRIGQEDAISDVQGLARELAGLMGGHPAYTNDFGRERFFTSKANWGYELAVKVERDRGTLLATKANWGAYWATTPESGLELYRGFLDRGELPKVRRLFVNPDFLEIPIRVTTGGTLPTPRVLSYLTGWKWPDRQRTLGVWHRFVDELCASTNLTTRAEGRFLRCAQAPNSEEHERSFRELITFLEAHQDALSASGFGEGLAADLEALIESRRSGAVLADTALDERKQMAKRFQQAMADSKARLAKGSKLSEIQTYLAAGAYDFFKFNALFSRFDYQPEDARVLLPLLQAYRSNITTKLELMARDLAQQQKLARASAEERARFNELNLKHAKLAASLVSVDRLEGLLNSKLNSAPAPTPASVVNSATSALVVASAPGRAPLPHGGIPASPFASGPPPPTNLLAVTRFWPLPDRLPQTDEPSALSIGSWCFREGRLWVDARAMRIGTFAGSETYFNRGAIFAIDLDSLKSEAVALDARLFQLPKGPLLGSAERLFEVHEGSLYVSSTDVIKRYSLKLRTWEDLAVPVQGHARITFIDGRMLLSTADSILESTPEGKGVRILASSRRQPPVTTLDAIAEYSLPPIIKGPAGDLIALVGGKFYERSRAGQDWVLLPSTGELARATRAVFDDGLVLVLDSQSFGQSEQVFALAAGSRAPELLIERAARTFSPQRASLNRPVTPSEASLQPHWRLPENVRALEAVCLEGESLWILSSTRDLAPGAIRPQSLRGQDVRGQDGLDVVLVGLQRGKTEPLTIPLRLQLPENPAASRRWGGLPGGTSLLEATPKGLVIARPGIPGFWFIPRSELVERQKASLDSNSEKPPQGTR